MKLRVIARLIEIQRVLVRHRLDEFVRATHLYRPLRFLFLLSPWTWFERGKDAPRGERLRLALQELGPIFVKFGQAMSTRRDLLPLDIADELAKLQDRVPPFDGRIARRIVEDAYGRAAEQVFSKFDEEPLAAASIAQVHTAELRPEVALNGAKTREVVVKVLRPDMHAVIARDLEVLHELARIAERHWEGSRRLKPVEVVAEYRKTIIDELDLMREAGNASQLRRNFENSPLLYVPAVHWDFCRPQVMVMERIRGVQISNMAQAARGRHRHQASWPRTASRSSSRRCSSTTSSTPTCTPATSSCSSTTRRSPSTPPSISASSARWIRATSTTSRKISWRCSTATTARWRRCTWSRAGCPKARASTRWNPRSARCASPSSTSR